MIDILKNIEARFDAAAEAERAKRTPPTDPHAALKTNVRAQRMWAKKAGRASAKGDRDALKTAEIVLADLVDDFERLLEGE